MFSSICRTSKIHRATLQLVPKSRNSTSTKPSEEKKPWQITAAVSVERMPSISPPLAPIAEKMQKMLDSIEFELSKKSDHEMRHEEDQMYAEMKQRGEPIPVERANIITAFDDEDRWKKDADKFKPASKTTSADETNDKTSLDRALDHSLFLVLKNQDSWTLPMSHNEKGESLRESAERALALHEINAHVIGNAPFTYFKNIYSKKYQESSGKCGEQIFIYKAFVQDSQKNETKSNHLWLRKSELEELDSKDAQFKKPLLNIIYDDED